MKVAGSHKSAYWPSEKTTAFSCVMVQGFSMGALGLQAVAVSRNRVVGRIRSFEGMGFFLLFVWGGSRGWLAPQCGDFLRLAYGVGQLRSAEISYAKRKKSHGLSPYEKKRIRTRFCASTTRVLILFFSHCSLLSWTLYHLGFLSGNGFFESFVVFY